MNPWARLTFIAMWNWADDFGRGTFNVRELLGFVFPNDENIDVGEFRRHVGEIRRHVGVMFYNISGRVYYAIPSWEKHQKIDKRLKGSKYPDPTLGEPWDPEKDEALPAEMGLSEKYADMSGKNSDMYGEPAEARRISVVGTGEQGNRGTGEEGRRLADEATNREAPNSTSNPTIPPQRNATVEALGADAPGRPDWVRGTLEDPRCPDHEHLARENVPACTACGRARHWWQQHEATIKAEGKAARRAAIDACDLCDTNGITLAVPAARCTHQKTGPEGPQADEHAENGQPPTGQPQTRHKATPGPF